MKVKLLGVQIVLGQKSPFILPMFSIKRDKKWNTYKFEKNGRIKLTLLAPGGDGIKITFFKTAITKQNLLKNIT